MKIENRIKRIGKYLGCNEEELVVEIMPLIQELLKEQREICAETLRLYVIQNGYSPIIYEEIKNAPEPE